MSGNKGRPLILWDSNIFLAWFKREKDKPLAQITIAAREVMNNHVVLFVSSITRVEVLDIAIAPAARDKFKRFCKRQNVVRAAPDDRIIDMANAIRQDAYNLNQSNQLNHKKIKTPDAIIAATAIIYKVPQIFSFDPDLLGYSGHSVLRGTLVTHPQSLLPPPPPCQPTLDFGPEPPSKPLRRLHLPPDVLDPESVN